MYYLYGNDRPIDKFNDFDTTKFEAWRLCWVYRVVRIKDENGNVLLTIVK